MTGRRISILLVAAALVVWPVAGAASPGGGASDERATGAFGVQAANGPTEIDSCTTITESGRYVLADDVESNASSPCVRIRASNVVLDGAGNALVGSATIDAESVRDRFFRGLENPLDPRASVGVAVSANRPLSNVTVANLTVRNWRWGIVADGLRGGRVAGVRATETAFGVAAFRSPRFRVTETTAADNAVFGVGVFGGPGATVTTVTASGNGVAGVYLGQGRNGVVADVTARDSELAGLLLDRTRGATVRDVETAGSRFGVYLFETRTSEVVGATATQARTAGVYALNATGPRITDTEATNNGLAGLLLQGTVGAEVTTTNASRNRYGVYLFFAEDTGVTDSTANDGVMGVFVRNATDAAVLNNTVLDNSFDGIYAENSTDVRVENNRDGALVIESTGNESLGEEGGYAANATIDVNQSDGLTDEELRAYVYRAIARAEELRGLEFEESFSIEVVTQEELRRRNAVEPEQSATVAAWENQLWEALFVVGEDRNSTQVTENESGRVAGFYNFYADKMVIVSDDDPPTVSSTTLVHEIVHALQDQHFDLTSDQLRPRTEDAIRARSGLVEGDARFVEERFEQLCGVVWNCVQVESEEPPGGEISPTRNFAFRQLILAPYSDGPNYVATLRSEDGWQAVNDAYETPPNSTEQFVHPERRTEEPISIDYEDTATAGWEKFEQSNLSFSGVNATTTVGEVGIFTMFWYQGYEYGNEIVGVNDHLYPNDATFDWFDYTADPSEGWGNDVLVPYQRETADGTDYGYVWRTAWDTDRDADEFHRAYLDLLDGQGAERVAPNTWVVRSGPFADAFRVVREGSNVTVVNAPTVDALGDLRPGLGPESGERATATTTGARETTTGENRTAGTATTTGENATTIAANAATTTAENATVTTTGENAATTTAENATVTATGE
ncbi:Hvo_1808 family surface protein [Halorussus salinus]|uniref:Hvo_1808 family surface protein n=1 Tax=Halorussus salinus TaxID=1364935 RepID=UPI0010921127|nr:Hvo_1808 family surface protein [Halorussus salinus]